jgi:hypothetical protein
MFDGAAFGNEMTAIVKAHVERVVSPLLARIDSLEKLFASLPAPVDHKAVDIAEVRQIAANEIAGLRQLAEASQPAPLLPDISKMVDDAIATLELSDLIEASVCEAFERAEKPKDGIGLTGALIDKSGHLVLTLSNGEVKDVGQVCGKDADPIEAKVFEDRVENLTGYVQARSSELLDEYRRGKFRDDFEAHLAEKAASSPPVTSEDVAVMIRDAFEQLAPGKDGISVTIEDVAPMIAAEVSKRVGELPVAKDGKPGKDADPFVIKQIVDEAINSIPQAQDGKDCDMEAVMKRMDEDSAIYRQKFEDAIASIPMPKDGTSITVADVAPLIEETVRRAVDAIPRPLDGRNGADLVGCFIDKNGDLTLTLSNGEVKNVGHVVGYDGADVDMESIRQRIDKMFSEWPKPKDGADGLGFDDLLFEYDGEKTITLKFAKGDRIKEFSFVMPVVIDKGVFKEGQAYAPGDGCTWDGCFWICQNETSEKPGTGKGWRLAIKKGRNGKDADADLIRSMVAAAVAEKKTVRI